MGLGERTSLLRQLPAVDEVLRTPQVISLIKENPRIVVVDAVRSVIDQLRNTISSGAEVVDSSREGLLTLVIHEVNRILHQQIRPKLRRVINATGVILHTNLGRALLSGPAQKAVQMAASGYCNLELDLDTGRRGSRYAVVEGLLSRLTGAEAALVVNNNAAAVLLALNTLAKGCEVIVSRGQLVEIGGSFRIPEVMAQSGAMLKEVGTTNKTYPDDYRQAINERTALLLHVHMSNYRILGFTRDITIEELVHLGHEFNLPVMSDLGSGILVDLQFFGLPAEPTVQQIVAAGADVVTFSGDKLLGGPQAGIIVGRKEYLEKMKKNPLTRAVRIDKLTVAALEATLRAYLDPEQCLNEIPTLLMLTINIADLKKRAQRLARELKNVPAEISLENTIARVGGGAMPLADLPSIAVAIHPKELSAEDLSNRLRAGEPAVLGRIQEDRLLLDVRTVQDNEIQNLAKAVIAALVAEKVTKQ